MSSCIATKSRARAVAQRFDGNGQPRARKNSFDARHVAGRQTGHGGGQFGRGDLADGDGLAVQVFSVARNILDGVADGVAEIQNGAQAGFRFILAHDVGLDFAAARHHFGKHFGVPLQEAREIAFEAGEEWRVVNDPVFDDLGESGAKFA